MLRNDLTTTRAAAFDQRPRSFLPGKTARLPWFCLSLLAASLSLRAATTFYVDSDWTGTQSGSASQPWKYLSSSAWSAINSSLAGGSVTVYLSARDASSDSDDVYDNNGDGAQDGIDLSMRSDTGSGILTLDGNSKYNSSDSSPNWVSYSGHSKSRVRYLTAQNDSHRKYSNITIHGFHVVTTDGNKEIAICGDNWIVENCECEDTTSATDGPGPATISSSATTWCTIRRENPCISAVAG